MDLQTNSINFKHYAYGGEYAQVSKKAAKFAAGAGQGVVDALTDFSVKRPMPNFNYEGNWFQRIGKQFKNPRWAVFDQFKIGVRKAEESASGQDTLVVQSSRFMSGKNIPGATVEVDIPYPPTREATLDVLEKAAAHAKEATARNYNALTLRNPSYKITEYLIA